MDAYDRPSKLGYEKQNQYPKSAQPLLYQHHIIPWSPFVSWHKDAHRSSFPSGKHQGKMTVLLTYCPTGQCFLCPVLCKTFECMVFLLFFYMIKKVCFWICHSVYIRYIVHQEIETTNMSVLCPSELYSYPVLSTHAASTGKTEDKVVQITICFLTYILNPNYHFQKGTIYKCFLLMPFQECCNKR